MIRVSSPNTIGNHELKEPAQRSGALNKAFAAIDLATVSAYTVGATSNDIFNIIAGIVPSLAASPTSAHRTPTVSPVLSDSLTVPLT